MLFSTSYQSLRTLFLSLFAGAASGYLGGCSSAIDNGYVQDNIEYFVVPDRYEAKGLKLDNTVFLFSVPVDATSMGQEQHYDGRWINYRLNPSAESRVKELYYAVFKSESDDVVMDTMDTLKVLLQRECGTTFGVPVLRENSGLKNSVRHTLICHEDGKVKIERDTEVTQIGEYVYVTQVIMAGDTKISDAELEMLTNVMVYSEAYPSSAYVRIVHSR